MLGRCPSRAGRRVFGQTLEDRHFLFFISSGILLLSTALITLVMSTLGANQQVFITNASNVGPVIPLCSWESTKTTVVGTILNVVNLFSWFIGVLSVAMALYSGFLFKLLW